MKVTPFEGEKIALVRDRRGKNAQRDNIFTLCFWVTMSEGISSNVPIIYTSPPLPLPVNLGHQILNLTTTAKNAHK